MPARSIAGSRIPRPIATYGPAGEFVPKHAKRYADVGALMREAAGRYVEEVRGGAFPTEDQSFS